MWQNINVSLQLISQKTLVVGFSSLYYQTIFPSLMSLLKISSISIETRFDNTSDLQHKAGRLSLARVSYQSRSCWRSAWRREGLLASSMNALVKLHEEGSWSDSAEGNDIQLKFLLYCRFRYITNFQHSLKFELTERISFTNIQNVLWIWDSSYYIYQSAARFYYLVSICSGIVYDFAFHNLLKLPELH